MHAQDDDDEFTFWMQLLGRALMQLSGTPDTLLPWLADELAPGGVSGVMSVPEPGPVRPWSACINPNPKSTLTLP